MLAALLLGLIAEQQGPRAGDWLLAPRAAWPAAVRAEDEGRTLILENGLARRAWRLGEGVT